MTEEAPLQWLSKQIGKHLTSGAIFNHQLLRLDPVRDKEIPNVKVTRPPATRPATILFQQDGALVVLENLVLLHRHHTLVPPENTESIG